MADLAPGTKKTKDPDTLAPLQTKLVKLRDTCHFSKSLVDWYRSHQEDNTQTPEGFSSCPNTKTNKRFFNFSPRAPRQRGKKVSRLRTDKNRNGGLSCFVGKADQFQEDIENPVPENKQKTQNQNNAAVAFTKNGNTVKFTFKHFADPEDVVSEYINAHVYNRTRLARVDKKKVFASAIALHNKNKEICTDFNDEAKPHNSLHALRTSEAEIHCNKRSTDVSKFERRLPIITIVEKEMATKNIIFELGDLDAVNKRNGRRDLGPALSVAPALSSSKDTNKSNARLTGDNKKVPRSHRVPTSISLLPNLKPNGLRSLNVENTDANSSNGRKTLLPDIGRGKNLSRRKKEYCRKPSADFGIKVPDVKSNWQLLKQRRNCTRRTDCTGQRTARLFDTLEKMSTEVNRMKNPPLNREADDHRIRNEEYPQNKSATIFPEKKYSETSLKYLNDGSKLKKVPKKSTRMGKMGSSEMNVVFENKAPPGSEKRENEGLKSEVDKYLDKYSLSLTESIPKSNQKKEVPHPNPEVVADMLAKLNIFDVGFHIDKEKRKESINVVTSPKKSVVSSPSRDIGVKTKSTSWDTSAMQNNEQREKLCTIGKTNGANQTENIVTRKNNAFVEMGLNGLEAHLSKDLCSQILKSDFLKKDFSKPARFFRTSLNFNKTLNSGRKFILNVDNDRSDSSPCNEWLQKKIRRIIVSSVRKDLKSSKEEQTNVERLEENNNNGLKKLEQIVEKRFDEKKGKKKSFAQKFLKVHTDILRHPRLQAILPDLIDGIPNFAKKPSR